jgi:hypothetical protein
MHRILLLAAVLLAVTPALAQEAHVVREGGTLTLTLPDGTTHAFALDAEAPLRVEAREGALVVDRGARPRLAREIILPDAAEIEAHVDSLLARVPLRFEDRSIRLGGPTGARIRVERLGEGSAELRREIADAERRSRHVAADVRRAEQAGRTQEAARFRAELRQSLAEAYDLREQARRAQADALRDRGRELAEEAAELDAEVEERRQRRDAIIERRERELLGEAGELDW